MARGSRNAFRPLRDALSQIDSTGAQAEQKLVGYGRNFDRVNGLRSPIDKLQRDLAAIDKKVRDIDRVLSKKLTLKLPFKTIRISVRQVIQSPGKVLDVALKPLTKLANKALKPVTSKLQPNIKVPKQLAQIPQELERLKSNTLNLDRYEQKLQNVANSNSLKKFQRSMQQLASTSTSKIMGR